MTRIPGQGNALSLFDAATTTPPTCKACGTTRRNLCRWAADREHTEMPGKQPRSCLLRYDPAKGRIPF